MGALICFHQEASSSVKRLMGTYANCVVVCDPVDADCVGMVG